MGSWLGRVAARYQMDVQELCSEYELDLGIDLKVASWLTLPAVSDQTLHELARLARLDEDRLWEIQTPDGAALMGRTQVYCARCLFVNPVDVTPRWKRLWLSPNSAVCEAHGTTLGSIASRALRDCKNFDQVLKTVGRLEFERARTSPF